MGQENRNIDNGTIIGTVPLLDQYSTTGSTWIESNHVVIQWINVNEGSRRDIT
jgi:hypothetical protein